MKFKQLFKKKASAEKTIVIAGNEYALIPNLQIIWNLKGLFGKEIYEVDNGLTSMIELVYCCLVTNEPKFKDEFEDFAIWGFRNYAEIVTAYSFINSSLRDIVFAETDEKKK